MLHHYFYNSMNSKKVQFILREKDNPDFLRKYDIVKRVRYTQKGKKRICVYLNFMFSAGGISIEEIIAYRNDYNFNFSC